MTGAALEKEAERSLMKPNESVPSVLEGNDEADGESGSTIIVFMSLIAELIID